MELIADVLLISAAAIAALYCHVLARRVRGLADLDKGLGGAIADLSRKAEGMRAALADAKRTTRDSSRELAAGSERAEAAIARLELLIAACRDLDAPAPKAAPARRRGRNREEAESGPMAEPEAASASGDVFEEGSLAPDGAIAMARAEAERSGMAAAPRDAALRTGPETGGDRTASADSDAPAQQNADRARQEAPPQRNGAASDSPRPQGLRAALAGLASAGAA